MFCASRSNSRIDEPTTRTRSPDDNCHSPLLALPVSATMIAVQRGQAQPTFSSHFLGALDTFKRVGTEVRQRFLFVCVYN